MLKNCFMPQNNENNNKMLERGFFHVAKIENICILNSCIRCHLDKGIAVDVSGAFCKENGQLYFHLDPETFGFLEDYPKKGNSNRQRKKLKKLGADIEDERNYEILRYDVIDSIIHDFDRKYMHPLGEVTIDFENTKEMEEAWTRLGWRITPADSSNSEHVSFNEFSDSFSSRSSASAKKSVSTPTKSQPQKGIKTNNK